MLSDRNDNGFRFGDHARREVPPARIQRVSLQRCAGKASWGNMLTDARSYFNVGTHLVIWPGILIMVTVLCFYLVGDGLRDALDPRSSWRLK